jgi:hypothetical protein
MSIGIKRSLDFFDDSSTIFSLLAYHLKYSIHEHLSKTGCIPRYKITNRFMHRLVPEQSTLLVPRFDLLFGFKVPS